MFTCFEARSLLFPEALPLFLHMCKYFLWFKTQLKCCFSYAASNSPLPCVGVGTQPLFYSNYYFQIAQNDINYFIVVDVHLQDIGWSFSEALRHGVILLLSSALKMLNPDISLPTHYVIQLITSYTATLRPLESSPTTPLAWGWRIWNSVLNPSADHKYEHHKY